MMRGTYAERVQERTLDVQIPYMSERNSSIGERLPQSMTTLGRTGIRFQPQSGM
jgi:hypothetical protein